MKNPYYIDERIGKIAICKHGVHHGPGLSQSDPHVVCLWQGYMNPDGTWHVSDDSRHKAEELLGLINGLTAEVHRLRKKQTASKAAGT